MIKGDQLVHFLKTCQVTRGPLAGGIQDGYHLRSGRYDFIYSETTGYAIIYFLNRYRRTGEQQWLDRARLASLFLANRITETGLPYSFAMPTGEVDPRYYVFDNAICVQGLADLWRVTKDKHFQEAVAKIGAWLATMHQGGDNFLSYISGLDQSREHPGPNFADDGGCLHIKNAIAFLKIGTILPTQPWRKLATTILEGGLDRQTASGSFPSQRARQEIFSHAHCYVTEGYLYAYLSLGDERYRRIAKAAADYLVTAQAPDGGIYQFNRRGQRASDATAQAIRIWQTLGYLDGSDDYAGPIAHGWQYLQKMQHLSDNPGTGAILYTRGRFGSRTPIGFTWVAMFTEAAEAIGQAGQVLVEEIY